MNLLHIRDFVIPVPVAEESVAQIQEAAAHGDERFVVWAGVYEGETFEFQRAIVPAQTAHSMADGLLVTVDADALFELNRDCYARHELLAGQIHAHPRGAYHSGADDELAIVAIPGGISIVIPDFARAGLSGVSSWHCFQLKRE